MDYVDAIYLLFTGSPSKEAALFFKEEIKIMMDRYYNRKLDVGKDAALDYIMLIKHADAMTSTVALLDEEKVEARNVWVELRKVMQIISLLRSDKTVLLTESYRLPGFTGEIIGRVLGNLQITNQLKVTKAQNDSLILENLQAQERELRIHTEKAEKQRQEKDEQVINGSRGGEYNASKARCWQLAIKSIVENVVLENNKREKKRSLKSMRTDVRKRFENSGIVLPKGVKFPGDDRPLTAYIKEVIKGSSEPG